MSEIPGINYDETKRRAQYLSMRSAQMAMEESEQVQLLEQEHPRGSRKQLVGTVLGIIAVGLILIFLAANRLI